MLSSIKKFFSTSNLLLLANDNSIVLYENHKGRLTAKLTIDSKNSVLTLIKALKKHINPKITLILDPRNESQKLLSIPDIGSIKTKDALKKKLLYMSGDILHPIVIQKPTKKSQTWQFLITKADLNPTIRNLIKTLLRYNISIYRAHLLSTGNMILCKRIQKLISKKISAPKNSYFFIYLQNSNGELHEFTLKNNNIINYKSENIDESELYTQIQNMFTRNKNKLKFQKIPENQVYLILLLPEQYRSNIKTDKNKIFLSARDISSSMLNRTTSGLCNYSSILNEIAFVKNSPEPLSIPSIKKLTFLETSHKISLFLTAAISLVLLSLSTHHLFSSYKENINVEEQLNNAKKLEYSLAQTKLLSGGKHALLKNNSDLNNLYNVISNNPYSLKMMTDISTANTYQLPIDRFLYRVTDITKKKYSIQIKINSPTIHHKDINHHFRKIDSFAANLEKKFPTKEVRIYRENSDNNTPITIQLSDIEE